jgi:DNA-directed RNA polymerase specialized sigma subunit
MMTWLLVDCTDLEKRVIVGLYAHGDSAQDLAAALNLAPLEIERIRADVVQRVKDRLADGRDAA